MLFHPYRFKNGEYGDGTFSPHFHLDRVRLGRIGKLTEQLEATTGWVYKHIAAMHEVSHVSAVIRYILTHVGVADVRAGGKNKKAYDVVRYFGGMGPRKFGVDKLQAAQRDVAAGLHRTLARRSKGNNPMFPASLVQYGGAAAGTEGGPPPEDARFIDVSIYEYEDKARASEGPGPDHTVAEFKSLRILKGRTRFLVRDAPTMYSVLAWAERNGRFDYPVLPTINPKDVRADGSIDPDAVAIARGDSTRTPAPRLLAITITPAVPDGAGGYTPKTTKDARPRVLFVVLSARLDDLCVICRDVLHLAKFADHLDLDDDHAPHKLPLNELVIVPAGKYLRPSGEDERAPLYKIHEGTPTYDFRLLVMPPHISKYPPGYAAAVRTDIERSEISCEYYMQNHERPTDDYIENVLAKRRERVRAATPTITVDNR